MPATEQVAAGAEGAATAQEIGGAPATNDASPAVAPSTTQPSRGVMDLLGIPAAVQSEVFGKEEKTEVGGQQSEISGQKSDEPATPPDEIEPAEAEESDADEAAEDAEAPTTTATGSDKLLKRVNKLTRQKQEAAERADALAAEVEELRGQLGQPPAVAAPVARQGNPLAMVEDLQTLQMVAAEAKFTINWCELNREGYTANEGEPNEKFVSPKDISKILVEAREALEAAPLRAQQIQQRSQSVPLAKQKYPNLFNRGHEDYQVAQAFLSELPDVARHPSRELIIGDYLRGSAARLAEQNGAARQPNPDLPESLTRKIPPLAPTTAKPPSGGPARKSQETVETAMNNMVTSGGTSEALTALVRAKREAAAGSASRGRQPALA